MIAVGRDSPSILKPSLVSETVPMCRLRISAPVVAAPVVFSINAAFSTSFASIPNNLTHFVFAAFSARFVAALNAFLPPAFRTAPLTALLITFPATLLTADVNPLAISPPTKNPNEKGAEMKPPFLDLYDTGITAFSIASASFACDITLRAM